MANKKCPKCGEDNPAEAVMCWACYTPLTAGAGAAMGAGGMGAAGAATLPRPGGPMGVPSAVNEGEKKQIDPKIFLVGGLLLVAAVVALFTTGIIGGSSPPGVIDNGIPTTITTDTGFVGTSGMAATPPPPPPPPTNNGPTGGSGEVVTPPAPSYSMVSSPNPRYSVATFGITPAQPNVSEAQATNLASTAGSSMSRSRKWDGMQIFVFRDAASASSFKQFMSQRQGKPLGAGDYQGLASQGALSGAIVYYEVRGKTGRVSYPSRGANR